MPRLYRVIQPVADLERAVRFYAAVLGVEGYRVSPGRHYFDCDGTILACYDAAADGDAPAGGSAGARAAPRARAGTEPLYFAVADLDATYGACRDAGARFEEGAPSDVGPLGRIARRPWGEVSFYARDPFGNPLCFVARETALDSRPE